MGMFSIRQTMNGGTKAEMPATDEVHTVQPQIVSQMKREFDSFNLTVALRSYCQSLPKESIAMAKRIDQMTPQVVGEHLFMLEADNSYVEEQLNIMKNGILAFMRNFMGDDDIQMSVTVREMAEMPKILSKPQQLQKMKEKNGALKKLEKEFDLVL